MRIIALLGRVRVAVADRGHRRFGVVVSVPFAGVRHGVPDDAVRGVAVLRAAVRSADVDAVVMWWASYVPTVDVWSTVDRLASSTDPLDVGRLLAVSRALSDFWAPEPGVVRSQRACARCVVMPGAAFVAVDGGAWMWGCRECHAVERVDVRRSVSGDAAFVCAGCGQWGDSELAERVALAHHL